MSTFTATNDAALPLLARRDVLATAVPIADRSTWVVKDPLTLEHHELGPAEYLVLTLLDGAASLRTLRDEYQRRFAPQTITFEALQGYLQRLHQAGLVVATSTGQGAALAERAADRRSLERRYAWQQLLAIRMRGVDPDRMLDVLHAVIRPLLHPFVGVCAMLLVLSAVGLLIANASEAVEQMPTLTALFAPRNWVWLAITVAAVKMMHELAHAMAAKHFGAEVHELGVLLLVFVPTLYCDVSDTWRLPSKWRRMAVSAAGMAMELVLAAGAMWVWWLTKQGLVHTLALNTMVVASIGTLLVNANPLMRYDGYYLLSDLCDAPNLWQRSRDAWRRWFSRLFIRQRQATDPEPAWLAIYGGLSSAYMLLVLAAICWAAFVALRPLGLGVLAYGLGVVMVASLVVGPARQASQTLANPIRRRDLRPISALTVVCLAIVVAGVAWRVPLSDHVTCPARVVPAEGRPLVTTMAGRLTHALPAGSLVHAGDVVAELHNDQIELAAEQLAGQLRLAQLEVEQLQALRARDAEASRRLPTARAALADIEQQVAEHQRERERLVLRAPCDGMLLPPTETPRPSESLTLANWSGTPLEPMNRWAWIEAGSELGMIADARVRHIALAIDEADIELVAPGQSVRVQLSAVGSRPLAGRVVEVANVGAKAEKNSLNRDARYEARVLLDACPDDLPLDSGGRAKIDVGSVTVGDWIVRELRDAVRLP